MENLTSYFEEGTEIWLFRIKSSIGSENTYRTYTYSSEDTSGYSEVRVTAAIL
jgi:hypothetical protein